MNFLRSSTSRSWSAVRTARCSCTHRYIILTNSSSISRSHSLSSRTFGNLATQSVPETSPHINLQSLSQSIPQQQTTTQSEVDLSQPIPQPFNQTVEMTDAAATRIGQLRAKHGPNTALRLSIDSGGCSGMSYKFEIDTAGPEPEDHIFTNQKDPQNKLIVDSLSLEHLAGSIIDYRVRIERSGFEVVANPNAAGKCGCGTSFQPKNF